MITTASPFCATPELQRALVAMSEPQEIAPGQFVFRQGDPPRGIYFVERGSVRLTLADEDGRFLSDRIAIEGSVLGLPASMTGNGYSLSAEVLAVATVRFVERNRFLELMRKSPDLCLQVVEILALEVGDMRRGADPARKPLN